MVSPDEFSGTPLVVGSIFGQRSWNVDSDGTLVSPTVGTDWSPDENVAGCTADRQTSWTWKDIYNAVNKHLPDDANINSLKSEIESYQIGYSTRSDHYLILKYDLPANTDFLSSLLFGRAEGSLRDGRWHFSEKWHVNHFMDLYGTPPEDTHPLNDCDCGYYAYFKNSDNEYFNENVVTGVIEGYGEVVVGPKGFRTKKAKIVALYVPQEPSYAKLRRASVSPRSGFSEETIQKIKSNYPNARYYDDYNCMIMEENISNPADLSWDDVA